jgi:NAD-dependent deacetylase
MTTSPIQKFANILANAKSLFIVTGAGLSAESGLPTYRGVGGLYNNRETDDGMPIETALSGPVFESQPEITWKYLAEIEAGARDATFNRGHEVLAKMESHFESVWILTQNVDGFHSAAGSTNVIEIHGNLHRMKCTKCDYVRHYEDYRNFELPPKCPQCAAMVRPDIVLFEEMLPTAALQQLQACSNMSFDAVISIGTSSNFPYIVQPVVMASQLGVPTIEINPGQTDLSNVVDLHIKTGAAAALNEVWKMLQTPNER